jgi:cytochrome c5
MRRTIVCFLSAALLLLGLGVALAQQKDPKAQSEPSSAPIPGADAEKKNPVKPTPEGLAEAKRLYEYHCAMCHGDASKETTRWNLVNLVRSFSSKPAQ